MRLRTRAVGLSAEMPGGDLAVSVVVPVRDGESTIPGLMESLRDQTLARGRFEVVVVDNGSSDRSDATARGEGARVVSEPRPNRSLARNAGAAAAAAPLLAFIDADCRAAPGWLEALAACLGESSLAAGPVEPLTRDRPGAVERFELLWRFPRERYVRESGWAGAANLGIRREVFEALGGFDAAFRVGGEDVELCLRADRAGHPVAWCEGAAVSHPAERRLGGLLRRAVRHGYASTHHDRRIGGEVGRRYWRHPGPLVRGDWALRRFQVDPELLEPGERRRMDRLARLDYAARMAGSLWAELRRAR